MPPPGARGMPGADRFVRKIKQARPSHHLVELAQVVEQYLRFASRLQLDVICKVTEDTVADAALRNGTQLFLHRFDQVFSPTPRQLDPYRINGGEPTDG